MEMKFASFPSTVAKIYKAGEYPLFCSSCVHYQGLTRKNYSIKCRLHGKFTENRASSCEDYSHEGRK